MHTFFINTSKKSLNEYDALFDIHVENKKLVAMECPLLNWNDDNKGYRACVERTRKVIDGFVDVQDGFNLIVYIDLTELRAFAEIPRGDMYDRKREDLYEAAKVLYRQMVYSTVIKDLEDAGRLPQSTLVLFGKDEQKHLMGAQLSESTGYGKTEQLLGLLGLPTEVQIADAVNAVTQLETEDRKNRLKQALEKKYANESVAGLRSFYAQEIGFWIEKLVFGDVVTANRELFAEIEKKNKAYIDATRIEMLDCPYDSYAYRFNNQVRTLSVLNLALHLQKCVETDSIYEKEHTLHPYVKHTDRNLSEHLWAKQAKYEREMDKIREIETDPAKLSEMNMIPRMYRFENERFGLDQYGEEDAAGKAGSEQKAELYQFGKISKNKPELYLAEAEKVRKHHQDYLKELQRQMTENFSDEMLKIKQEEKKDPYNYSQKREKDTQKIGTVKNLSEKAYRTVIERYNRYCAERTVALTEVEKQYDWLKERFDEITECIRKVNTVATALMLFLLSVLVPSVIVQLIRTDNVFTQSPALAVLIVLFSVAIPIVVAWTILFFVNATKKAEYKKVWNRFCEESRRALSENNQAVAQYEKYLRDVIPSLRKVYNYKQDVDYYAEAYAVAESKIEHHRDKLNGRLDAIKAILTDLGNVELSKVEKKASDDGTKINYNDAYCRESNRAFYTLFQVQGGKKQ